MEDFEINLTDLKPEAIERLEKWLGGSIGEKLWSGFPEHAVLTRFDYESYHPTEAE